MKLNYGDLSRVTQAMFANIQILEVLYEQYERQLAFINKQQGLTEQERFAANSVYAQQRTVLATLASLKLLNGYPQAIELFDSKTEDDTFLNEVQTNILECYIGDIIKQLEILKDAEIISEPV